MKRKHFTEEQIIGVLREQEAGAKTGDLARKHGVSEAALYNWKAKFGGMDVSDDRRRSSAMVGNSLSTVRSRRCKCRSVSRATVG